jgi:uncharacterized protein
MTKIIGLNLYLEDDKNNKLENFKHCILDLLNNDYVKQLDNFKQHINTSRLQHSINVAYYSYRFCRLLRFFGFDHVSAARAGLMHDLYLYDWNKIHTKTQHTIKHPQAALQNARQITDVNHIEADAIAKHMFPLCAPPKYKESYIVSIADKYCTIGEVISAVWKKMV